MRPSDCPGSQGDVQLTKFQRKLSSVCLFASDRPLIGPSAPVSSFTFDCRADSDNSDKSAQLLPSSEPPLTTTSIIRRSVPVVQYPSHPAIIPADALSRSTLGQRGHRRTWPDPDHLSLPKIEQRKV